MQIYNRSKNCQSFDLGLNPLLDVQDEINQAIRQLASKIDLMMITEYMEESLILLKVGTCIYNCYKDSRSKLAN